MKTINTLLGTVSILALLLLWSCSGGTLLSSESLADISAERGTYTLVLYGGQNAYDLSSIAILDRTDDTYTILPYGATFNYRRIENLSGSESLLRGERFISDIYSYRATEKRVIYAPDHSVIGYELRPLFMPLDIGLLGDILATSYVLQADNQVVVYIGFRGGYQSPLDSTDSHFFGNH